MKLPSWNSLRSRSVVGGVWLTLGLGLVFWGTRLGQPLAYLGADLPYLLAAPSAPEDLLMVYLDEASYRDLGQSPSAPFDRALHARALRHMTRDHVRLVAYDILFVDPVDAAATQDLADAMKENGNVVVAAVWDPSRQRQLGGGTVRKPVEPIETAAAAVGLVQVPLDGDDRVRRPFRGSFQGISSLPEAAFSRLDEKAPDNSETRSLIRYHGPHPTLRSLGFADVERQEPGYFSNKVVFVGVALAVNFPGVAVDAHQTPVSRWKGGAFPGAAILATIFQNLRDGAGLDRLSGWSEAALVVLAALLLGGLGSQCAPRWSLLLGCVVGVLAAVSGVVLFLKASTWWAWPVVACVQAPAAMAWGVSAHYRRLLALKRGIPDHQMLKCVGRGAYGQVWLARNAVGIYHAVKILHRSEFEKADPYEREFRGIQKFMPVSRSHPGFVNILHVGLNEREGFFFYIMETADDVVTGANIGEDRYEPLTLAGLLKREGALPLDRCVALGRSLCQALAHLHGHDLIHRDIKPANIIYVHGEPKFADIGLVTHVAKAGKDVTMVGTAAYMAPEGPGTPAADLYSLGKVLYESGTGLEADLFPEMPTGYFAGSQVGLRREFNRILGRACDHDVRRRYAAAADLEADLAKLQEAMGDGGMRERG